MTFTARYDCAAPWRAVVVGGPHSASRRRMTAPLVGKRVLVSGLNGRPELNGKYGRAASFNDATNRYNVQVESSGETVALRPSNLEAEREAAADAQPSGTARAPLPAIDPKTAAGGLFFALVYLLGFSMLNAGLLCALGYGAFQHSSQHGGMASAKLLASRGAAALQRLTGVRITPAQAGFLLVSVAGLVSYYWLWPAPSTSSTASGNRYADDGRRYRGGESDGMQSGGILGSGWDLSFMISAGMLGSMIWRFGGGGQPGGWSLNQFWHKVRNMDMFQMMMLLNLVQSVFGGGRRGGMGGMGGFGRRGRYF